MGIEFFTGFEEQTDVHLYFTAKLGSNPAMSVATSHSSAGFNGSRCMKLTQSAFTTLSYLGAIYKNISSELTKVVGFHAKNLTNAGRYDTHTYSSLLTLQTESGTQFYFSVRSGYLYCYNGSTYLGHSTKTITTSLKHFEIKLYSHSSLGSITVKMNGEIVLNLTGINTTGSPINRIYFGTFCSEYYIDNLFVADDWQGELYSQVLKPSSDDVVQFTPLSGTDNFAMIQTNDGDTSYNKSDTIGHQDLFNFEDLDVGLIPKSVSVYNISKKEGTGPVILTPVLNQDSTDYEGKEYTLDTSYPSGAADPTFIEEAFPLAPDGTPWTREKVNMLKIGYKIAGEISS